MKNQVNPVMIYCKHYFGMLSSSLVLILILFACPNLAHSQAKVWEGEISIPTYGWLEDVNPKLWALEGGAKGATTVKASLTYPYNMQDHLSRKLESVTYQAIFLENEYLKITCLPELGGRLHSVYNKITKSEVFHLNKVIKPSMIAMRGAFISGGVEWNAGPQVHTVTILSPVNVWHQENDDGSAFIEVSNLEKSLRTRWTVRVTLYPGKSYLEEKISIRNEAEAMNPYYFWNCTAFPQLPGTRFIYPMKLGTDHFGLEFFDWPIHEGNDLSWTKNYDEASSIFAINCAYDFFGAYDVDLDQGIVQVADHREHSGKKAWTWGQGEYGRVSQLNLTDDDGNYIEVQSGPLQTQSDYGHLIPQGSVSWTEHWYPVHGLGDGFEYATEKLACQTMHSADGLQLRIIGTEAINQVVCEISSQGQVVHYEKFDISPIEAREIKTQQASERYSIRFTAENGALLAEFTTPLDIPDVAIPEPPSYFDKADSLLSTDELYRKALRFDRALDRNQARLYYKKALALDPFHTNSIRNLAVLDYESGLYKKAKIALTNSLAQLPNDDGVAWYFLGLCELQAENWEGAMAAGYKAARCSDTGPLGYDLAGRGHMLNHEPKQALELFERAWKMNPENSRIFHHYLLALWANHESGTLNNLVQDNLRQKPSDIFLAAINSMIDNKLDDFGKEIRLRLGEDDFELIDLSLIFAEMGLYEAAASVLEASSIEVVDVADQSFLAQYYLSYFYYLAGNETKAGHFRNLAADNYKDYILPSRPAAIPVFEYALKENPQDALAWYQLGNVFANLGRVDEGAKCWMKAAHLEPEQNSIVWRNLGLYHWTEKDDHAGAIKCYLQAIQCRTEDQTLYRDLARIYVDHGQGEKAIELLEEMPFEVIRRSDIIIDLAQNYLDNGHYDEAVDLLLGTPYFVNWEGSSITWNIFNKSLVAKGIEIYNQGSFKAAIPVFEKALTFPANLGVGQSFRTEEAKARYWLGLSWLKLGKSQKALSNWSQGSQTPDGSQEQNHFKALCSELSK